MFYILNVSIGLHHSVELRLPHQPQSTTVTEHFKAPGCEELGVRMAEDSTNTDTNKHREENLSLKLRLTTIQS